MYYAYQKVNISIGFAQRKITTAYQLSNGVMLLPTEREPNGWYRGGCQFGWDVSQHRQKVPSCP